MVEVYDATPKIGGEPTLATLLAVLDDGTREWREELGDLNESDLVNRPFPGGPSIGAVLLHMAEVEAWWIQTVLGGRPLSDDFKRRTLSDETRQDEGVWGDAPQMPYAAYLDLLDEVRAQTHEALQNERDVARVLKPDPERPALTVRWIVGHVVQHDSYHGGQCVLVKRMLRGGMW